MDKENKYGTYEIQEQLLELLKTFHDFCKSKQITYTVSSGTLLGAVRHKGFIPWDDDIDVITDRENYKKLFQYLPNDLLSIEHGSDESLWIDRVRPAHDVSDLKPTIDVFIFDSIPRNHFKSFIKVMLLKMLQGMMKGKPDYSKFSITYKVVSFVTYYMGCPFSTLKKRQWYDIVSEWGNNRPFDTVMLSNDRFTGFRYKYPKDLLNNIIILPFEDTEICAMSRYDEYLTMIYGDYMTPPAETNRKPTHT